MEVFMELPQDKLTDVSKGSGLLVVVLANIFPPEAVFSAITVIMIFLALRISGNQNTTVESQNAGSSFNWLGKMGDLLGKFHYVERILFISKITLNVVLSYIVAAVLVNVLVLSASNVGDL